MSILKIIQRKQLWGYLQNNKRVKKFGKVKHIKTKSEKQEKWTKLMQ